MKTCSKCSLEQPLSSFHADHRVADGKARRCKTCANAATASRRRKWDAKNPEKLAAYAVLARPAMEKAGAKFIARGVPFAVKEDGEAVRTIVIEWESMEAAENGYNSPDYQNALKALDNGAKRAFMYLDAD